MTIYNFGALVEVSAVFTDSAGSAIDPTTVKVEVASVALGTTTTYVYGTDVELVKDSVGHYHLDIDTSDSSGQWNWRFYSTGTGQGSAEGSFYVRPSGTILPVPPVTNPTGTGLVVHSGSGVFIAREILVGSGLSISNGDGLGGDPTLSLAGGMLVPASPSDATKFLNGAATPAFAQVKGSDLSMSDVTTNNVTSTKHGFVPKSPANSNQFLNGAATPAFAQPSMSNISDYAAAQTWIPTWGGFSVAPSGGTARYVKIGKLVACWVQGWAGGTSNATTKTITLPVAAANADVAVGMGHAFDNGVSLDKPCRFDTRAGSTTADIFKDLTGASWTASGSCVMDFFLVYQAQ